VRAVAQVEEHRLEVVELTPPVPGTGELLIRVAACGICGSDLSSYKRGLFTGVLGHEVAGTVEAIGPAVEGWRPGDPVALAPSTGCGDCDQCRAGDYHRCIESLTGGGSVRPGGYAELLVAPAGRLWRLPPGLGPEVACLAEPLSVALHGIGRLGSVRDRDAIVLGLGSIGLLACAGLRWCGARRVYGVDPVGLRRDLALGLGVEAVFSRASDARADLEPIPLVLECSGRPEALQQAIDLAAPGGSVALLGIAIAEVPVIPVFWITREITVTGCINSRLEDFGEALRLLQARPEIGDIVTRRVPLDEVPATFERLLQPEGVGKVVVDPRR
jgi:threonine dehydrogenase-like Zn-dependent dehydrogenase